MPLSTLRAGLKTAITSNTNYTAYDHVPEIIIPPAALILASDPYLEPIVIGNNKNWYVRLTLEVVSTTYSNPSALTNLEDDIENYFPKVQNDKFAYITQTTLSVDDTLEIISLLKKKYPSIKEPIKSDICYATTNRQEAVKKIAKKCDLFLVVGSKSSSNSQRLVEVAKRFGCKESILMHSDQELPVDKIKNSKNIGITSGASAPEILVENLIKEIKSVTNVKLEEVITSVENVSFKLPTILIK